MNRFLPGFLAGIALTAIGFVAFLRRPEPLPPAPPPLKAEDPRLEVARKEIERLKTELDTKKAPAPEPEPAPRSAPDAPKAVALDDRFATLLEKGLAALAAPEMRAFIDEIKARGAEGVAFLAARLKDGKTSQERFLAAAALEGAGDAAAIPALAEALKKDPDDLVRRMASHAIAVLANESGEAPLRAAMTGDADWGVRVNSAYGLAKIGRDDGLRMLEIAYGSSETPAEYRLAILGGLADVASPATAPLFRRILSDTKDMSYLLMAVNALGKMKDGAARADLERLAASEGVPQSVREAARKVVDSLGR